MPNRQPPLIEEVQRLADALFDGTITDSELRQLDQSLLAHPHCLQAYVERLDLHAVLLSESSQQSDEEATLAVLQDFATACQRREAQQRRRALAAIAASVLLIGGFAGWFLGSPTSTRSELGRITHLTAEGRQSPLGWDLGRIVRAGDVIKHQEGVLSVTLDKVILDLVGPADVKLLGPRLAQLRSGTVHAQVLPGGEGFCVRTPDAEVIDLGTEFLVAYDPRDGTEVVVRQGRARVGPLASADQAGQVLELTSHRAARLARGGDRFEESAYQPERFQPIDRSRSRILSLDGMIRTAGQIPESLQSEQTTTPNHLLVVPEQQSVVLTEDLVVAALDGVARIPAGASVSSYLVHYDPSALASRAPRGAITFQGRIAACLTSTDSLLATDALFGLTETAYETGAFRGLERDADEVTISAGEQTVSFYFGMSPPAYLDEVRVLVVSPSLLSP